MTIAWWYTAVADDLRHPVLSVDVSNVAFTTNTIKGVELHHEDAAAGWRVIDGSFGGILQSDGAPLSE